LPNNFGHFLDRKQMIEARKVWKYTHDAGKALAALRGFQCMERQLLEGLKRRAKNDVVTALSAVCLRFVHSLHTRTRFCQSMHLPHNVGARSIMFSEL